MSTLRARRACDDGPTLAEVVPSGLLSHLVEVLVGVLLDVQLDLRYVKKVIRGDRAILIAEFEKLLKEGLEDEKIGEVH